MFNQYRQTAKKPKTRLDALKAAIGDARYNVYTELEAKQRNHLQGLPFEQINIFLDILNLEQAHEQQALSTEQTVILNGLYQDVDTKYKVKLFDFMGRSSPIIHLIQPNKEIKTPTVKELSLTLSVQRKAAKTQSTEVFAPGPARRQLNLSS